MYELFGVKLYMSFAYLFIFSVEVSACSTSKVRVITSKPQRPALAKLSCCPFTTTEFSLLVSKHFLSIS